MVSLSCTFYVIIWSACLRDFEMQGFTTLNDIFTFNFLNILSLELNFSIQIHEAAWEQLQ